MNAIRFASTGRAISVVGYLLGPYFLAFGLWGAPDGPRRPGARSEAGFIAALAVTALIPALLVPRLGPAGATLAYYGGAAAVIVFRAAVGPRSRLRLAMPQPLDSRLGAGLALLVPIGLIAWLLSPAIAAVVNGVSTATPVTVSGHGADTVGFHISKTAQYGWAVTVTGEAPGCRYSTLTLRSASGGGSSDGAQMVDISLGSSLRRTQPSGTFGSGDWTVQLDATAACAWRFDVTPQPGG